MRILGNVDDRTGRVCTMGTSNKDVVKSLTLCTVHLMRSELYPGQERATGRKSIWTERKSLANYKGSG